VRARRDLDRPLSLLKIVVGAHIVMTEMVCVWMCWLYRHIHVWSMPTKLLHPVNNPWALDTTWCFTETLLGLCRTGKG
jgi:hypothetical protein